MAMHKAEYPLHSATRMWKPEMRLVNLEELIEIGLIGRRRGIQGVQVLSQPKQFLALVGSCFLREQPSRLRFQGLPDNIVPANILGSRNANPSPDARPALDEALRFKALQGIRNRNHTHFKFRSQLAPRERRS